MIRHIKIENYKGISNAEFDIHPLTILTGLNSTGKSTCFQSVLTSLYYSDPLSTTLLENLDYSFDTLRNRNINAQALSISIICDSGEIGCEINRDEGEGYNTAQKVLESNIYYLWANRLGYTELETISPKYNIGIAGEYIFGTFEKEKSNPVYTKLQIVKESETLSSHLNYWLSYILGIKFEMQTERITPNKAKVIYKSDDLANLSPQQLGVGVSYLAKILIMCLRAKKGDVIMIENPEIHLHPAAQSKLGEFFAYIVNAGIQVLLETHCEHLISRLQYEVFKNRLTPDKIVLYYKASITDDFIRINFNSNGKFETEFPEGFFDATLDELLEME